MSNQTYCNHSQGPYIHQNKVPCELLFDAKPPIKMYQGHPKKQQKTCWQSEICVRGGGG